MDWGMGWTIQEYNPGSKCINKNIMHTSFRFYFFLFSTTGANASLRPESFFHSFKLNSFSISFLFLQAYAN